MNPVRIQAGHVNIAENCDHGLRGGTGAHGEVDYVRQIAAIVSGALSAHGIDCGVWDANANCDGNLMRNDWGAVVSLHCDGRDQSGFAVGVGNPTEDGAAEASKQLANALRSAYSAANPSLEDLSDAYTNDENITEYYLFRALSPDTPFALVELGAVASATGNLGPDQLYLYNHAHEVASGIVEGVLAFLGLPPSAEQAQANPSPEPVPVADEPGPPPSEGNPDNAPVTPPAIPNPPPLVGPPPAEVPETQPTIADVEALINAGLRFIGEALTELGKLRQ